MSLEIEESAEWVTDDDEALSAFVNLLVVLADNKHTLGVHLADWAVGAPTLESGVAAAALAQGEFGQARLIYPLLGELPAPPGLAEPPVAGHRGTYAMACLDGELPTWPHLVAAMALCDTAVTVVLEALGGSRHEGLARRVPRMLEEEAVHADFAAGRVRELVGLIGGRPALQERVTATLPEVLCWFGPSGEAGLAALVREGLCTADNERMRAAFLGRVVPLLEEVGIDAGDVHRDGEGSWTTPTLPWDRWDPLRRRLTTTARPAPGAAPTVSSASG